MQRSLLILLAAFAISCGQKELELFSKLSSNSTGIGFKNIIKESEAFNVLQYGYLYNGGGVAIGDINGDLLPDIYFTGNLVASRLYVNKGNLKFEEIAENAGVLAEGLWNTGTAMADVNGDGMLDIYVCRSAAKDPDKRRNLLFINNGDLTFEEKASSYGLDDPSYSTHAAFFDYDCDGDLDVYVLNHSLDKYAGFDRDLELLKRMPGPEFSDRLFRNDGQSFSDVSMEAGLINNVLGFGLGLAVVDLNMDNWPDIYVSNDYNEEDYLYINQRDGTFRELLSESMGHVSLSSMGNESGDFNNDMIPDIISLDMLPEKHYELKMAMGPENYDKYDQLIDAGFYHQSIRNMLQLNNGDGTFSEIGQLAGISRTDWSWAALLADYDNDGWKDLLITNGYGKNYLDMDVMNFVANEKVRASRENRPMVQMELLASIPSIMPQNYMYQNNKDLTFRNRAIDWGLEDKTLSNGAAYADLDNDGDLDLVINNINEEASVYRNNTDRITFNNYIKVKLQGTGKNTFGVGAKVQVISGEIRQMMEMMPSRGFQSSVNPELVFGLENNSIIDTLNIVWPDSSVQNLFNVSANQTLVLQQSDAYDKVGTNNLKGTILTPVKSPLGLDHLHRENAFDDFGKDKLLPRGHSRVGPKMGVADVNGDGLQDVYFGGAKGTCGALYIQTSKGTFTQLETEIFESDSAYEDTDVLFFDADGDHDLDLYVASGGSDFTMKDPLLQDRLYVNDGNGRFYKAMGALPELQTSNSCVTAADIDVDGDMDLFVGGKTIPGNYPAPPGSYVLVNNGEGNFTDETSEISSELSLPGMVSDAAFADLNNDRLPDLVVVGEWMKVSVFLNESGKLIPTNDPDLNTSFGWWNTIIAEDLDMDGDLDLMAGNMGMNNLYNAAPSRPVKLFYKDFDNNGKVDPVMTFYIDESSAVAFSRDELLNQIPTLETQFPDYDTYARTQEKELLKILNLEEGDSLIANTFESVYLLNDGRGKFLMKSLPVEAQFSPVYAMAVDDFNSDGLKDILLGGNQSDIRPSAGRQNASYGLLLLGMENGSFRAVPNRQTGLKVFGDVRSIATVNNSNKKYVIFGLNNRTPEIYEMKN